MAMETPQLKASLFGVRAPTAHNKSGSGAPQKKGPPKAKGPPGVRIEHRIGIQAPTDCIWEAIYELERWSEWNPMYVNASGKIGIGQPLKMTRQLPGQAPVELQPTVMEWVPHEQLHFRSTTMGGFVKTIHYIEIEKLADTGCVVSSGELVSGLMASAALRSTGRATFRAVKGFNEALKERAESLWRARQNQPISI